MSQKLRNIAIIAHVDHGKTTLVDKLLSQAGAINLRVLQERVMDSNDLEKERGITIFAKHASLNWQGYKINIVDTPGHADFGGEVERVLSMVDSVLLLVDAMDGPMPQTRFVTQKSFEYGLKPILVINKIDRPGARPNWVIDQVFDLFVKLDANDDQLDFPIVYTSALLGKSGASLDSIKDNMDALFKAIIDNVPKPTVNPSGPFQLQVVQLDYDNYLGMLGIGRIHQGSIRPPQNVSITDMHGNKRLGKIAKVLKYEGLQKVEVEEAQAGDIVSITGIGDIRVGDSICDPLNSTLLAPLKIDEPTVSVEIGVNSSPFSGQEGKFLTSRQIWERLQKEAMYNVALKIEPTKSADFFRVSGRGELHLSILIETLRREGFEMSVSRPKVIYRQEGDKTLEPFENAIIEIPSSAQGKVMNLLAEHKGNLEDITHYSEDQIRLSYTIPSRGLIGLRSKLLSLTAGSGILHSSFSHYQECISENIGKRQQGVLISNATGKALAFALNRLQERGHLLIGPGTQVYEGQIVGLHNRSNDLTVNCITGKQLTNIRAAAKDDAIILEPPLQLSLEKALTLIDDDELIEVTPSNLRLRKKHLKESDRKRASRG